jgi:hypothetical protein
MKKIILPVFLLFVLSGTSFGQGLYLRAGTGYGMPVATASIGEQYQHIYDPNNTSSTNTYSTKVVKASYGAGLDFNFAVGYKFNENFIFDLNVQYLLGNKFETSNTYIDKGTMPGTEKTINTTSSRGFLFNPSVIFSAGFGKAAPYGRFGLVVSSPTITDNQSYYYDLDGTSTRDITWIYNKGMGLGYQAAVGMNWKLSDMLDIYTEANFISMTYYPAKGEMTKYDGNGNDMLPNMSVYQKQISFEKSYDPQASYDPNQPRVQAIRSYPFSSASVQVGVRFTIWKKSE